MAPTSMTLCDLWARFQGHDIIQRQITRKQYNIELYLWRSGSTGFPGSFPPKLGQD